MSPQGSTFPVPSTPDLMLWHLLLGLVVAHVGIYSPAYQLGLYSSLKLAFLHCLHRECCEAGTCVTWWAVCPTGPFRNVFKEGTRFSALLRQSGQACWENVLPTSSSLIWPLYQELQGRASWVGVHFKDYPKKWKNKTLPLEQRGEWWTVDLSSEAPDQFITEAVQLLSQFRVQLTTGPWFERRLLPVFLRFILI